LPQRCDKCRAFRLLLLLYFRLLDDFPFESHLP
jgi:hypothetical protein